MGLLGTAAAAAPALVLLILEIGRHEREFRHSAVTLGFVSGLGLGLGVSILLAFSAGAGVLWSVLALPLVVAMPPVLVAGLPRFRGTREAIWVGGATALGEAAMLMQWWTQQADPDTLEHYARVLAIASGFTLVMYAAGLKSAWETRWTRHFRGWLLAYGLLVPAFILQYEINQGGAAPFGGAWIVIVLALAYGAALTVWSMRTTPKPTRETPAG